MASNAHMTGTDTSLGERNILTQIAHSTPQELQTRRPVRSCSESLTKRLQWTAYFLIFRKCGYRCSARDICSGHHPVPKQPSSYETNSESQQNRRSTLSMSAVEIH